MSMNMSSCIVSLFIHLSRSITFFKPGYHKVQGKKIPQVKCILAWDMHEIPSTYSLFKKSVIVYTEYLSDQCYKPSYTLNRINM